MNDSPPKSSSGLVPIAGGSANAMKIGALIGQADALHDAGRLADAEAVYRRAAKLGPRVPEIQFGWATVLSDLGRLQEAAQVYRDLLANESGFAEAHVNLGIVLHGLGQLHEAASELQKALSLRPGIAIALVELVSVLCSLDRSREAVERAMEAMRQNPRPPDACRAFAVAVARGPRLHQSAEIAACLEHCLSSDDVEHDDLAKACAWQLRQAYKIDGSPEEAARRAIDAAIADSPETGCFSDPLLLRFLTSTINTDLELEAFLTETRRSLALAPELPARLDPFLAALALQCFDNGYVFATGAEEEARVDALSQELVAELSGANGLHADLERKILCFALYRPLARLPDATRLLDAAISPSPPLKSMIAHCLAEPLREAEFAREVPSLGTIDNAVSRVVRDQYEEHPYPRWRSAPRIAPVPFATFLHRKFPRAPLPTASEGPIEVLVVGGGTGRQPITTALSLAHARVLAVDLSRASLGYAMRMARRLGVSNVSFLQADLLSLAKLGRDFLVVEAVGVLHHMEDPMAGWRALCELLRPGGFMLVGLYSALARAEVVAARERIAELGIPPVAKDIRAFRHRLLLGNARNRYPRLAHSRDIFDLNGCRDLLFHAKEHRFTIPQLQNMMSELGLDFLGFDLVNERALRAYRAENLADPTASDLARWARFEQKHPDAFSGMYVFWCRKKPA